MIKTLCSTKYPVFKGGVSFIDTSTARRAETSMTRDASED